jgi:hypothetical protein
MSGTKSNAVAYSRTSVELGELTEPSPDHVNLELASPQLSPHRGEARKTAYPASEFSTIPSVLRLAYISSANLGKDF